MNFIHFYFRGAAYLRFLSKVVKPSEVQNELDFFIFKNLDLEDNPVLVIAKLKQ